MGDKKAKSKSTTKKEKVERHPWGGHSTYKAGEHFDWDNFSTQHNDAYGNDRPKSERVYPILFMIGFFMVLLAMYLVYSGTI